MSLSKSCGRAAENIIVELAMYAERGSYPEHLTLLVDGLINLTDFLRLQLQLEQGNSNSDDRISGGPLVYKMLSSTYVATHSMNLQKMENYGKLIFQMCVVNDRFKTAFINDMKDPDCGIEAFRFELGDAVANLCAEVIKAIG